MSDTAVQFLARNPGASYFAVRLGELRAFIHRLGTETDQGQMSFEFDGEFYLIDFPATAA